ncbi:Inhibitor of the KinA pathway to sporulation, predicted exonuclease [Butyrivibrio sp. ob235]|uniref:3'-5' exonuclease n=1 Tax=Butyrivibrio sp. ob235 TaxID=1761780 RepID=UPI0008BDCFD2|nr:3'-5' exonuclease [Butyrivibrio sp. ob235]SEM22135.1 Inhibitor of the KinA pathway to sporulation, predicted exonuclease [Butyrivibrio sp. ob235]
MKYAVVDLEMCVVPKGYRKNRFKYRNETIQIGAVLLNENYEVVDEFNSYVKPEYGCIDSFIENLTGITEKDVAKGPAFEEALESFLDWLPADDVRCVSWSDSDPMQIIHEASEKGIADDRLEIVFANWIDCQKTFSRKMDQKRAYSLEEALFISNIAPEGSAHDGLVDAANTAVLFTKLETDPDYRLNEFYETARKEEVDHLSFSLGDLFAGIAIA